MRWAALALSGPTYARLASWLILDLREVGQWALLLALAGLSSIYVMRAVGAAAGFIRACQAVLRWLVFDLREVGHRALCWPYLALRAWAFSGLSYARLAGWLIFDLREVGQRAPLLA